MAFADDIIQQLQMRPKCYITIYAGKFTISRKDIKAGQLTIDASKFNEPIGAIQRLSIDSSRDTVYRRELKYTTAGKPVETIPGLVSYKLSLERVVLYSSMIPKAFGFNADYDIIKQNTPLTLKIELPGPEGNAENKAKYSRVWYVYGVWLDSNPLQFDVTAVNDLRIIQSVEAIAAGIIAGKP